MQPVTAHGRGFLTFSAISGIALMGLLVITTNGAQAAATTAGRSANLVVGQATTDRIAKAVPQRQPGGHPPAEQESDRKGR